MSQRQPQPQPQPQPNPASAPKWPFDFKPFNPIIGSLTTTPAPVAGAARIKDLGSVPLELRPLFWELAGRWLDVRFRTLSDIMPNRQKATNESLMAQAVQPFFWLPRGPIRIPGHDRLSLRRWFINMLVHGGDFITDLVMVGRQELLADRYGTHIRAFSLLLFQKHYFLDQNQACYVLRGAQAEDSKVAKVYKAEILFLNRQLTQAQLMRDAYTKISSFPANHAAILTNNNAPIPKSSLSKELRDARESSRGSFDQDLARAGQAYANAWQAVINGYLNPASVQPTAPVWNAIGLARDSIINVLENYNDPSPGFLPAQLQEEDFITCGAKPSWSDRMSWIHQDEWDPVVLTHGL